MPSLFYICFYSYFLKLIVTCKLCVIYMREDNDYSVNVMITCWYGLHRPWCQLSKKGVKLDRSLTHPVVTGVGGSEMSNLHWHQISVDTDLLKTPFQAHVLSLYTYTEAEICYSGNFVITGHTRVILTSSSVRPVIVIKLSAWRMCLSDI